MRFLLSELHPLVPRPSRYGGGRLTLGPVALLALGLVVWEILGMVSRAVAWIEAEVEA
jgi:hypothetical protein